MLRKLRHGGASSVQLSEAPPRRREVRRERVALVVIAALADVAVDRQLRPPPASLPRLVMTQVPERWQSLPVTARLSDVVGDERSRVGTGARGREDVLPRQAGGSPGELAAQGVGQVDLTASRGELGAVAVGDAVELRAQAVARRRREEGGGP